MSWLAITPRGDRNVGGSDALRQVRRRPWSGGTGATGRGYGKSVVVSMDVVDEGQAHLDALHEMLDRWERIGKERPARPLGAGASWSV